VKNTLEGDGIAINRSFGREGVISFHCSNTVSSHHLVSAAPTMTTTAIITYIVYAPSSPAEEGLSELTLRRGWGASMTMTMTSCLLRTLCLSLLAPTTTDSEVRRKE